MGFDGVVIFTFTAWIPSETTIVFIKHSEEYKNFLL